jgi:hypothetical protein
MIAARRSAARAARLDAGFGAGFGKTGFDALAGAALAPCRRSAGFEEIASGGLGRELGIGEI